MAVPLRLSEPTWPERVAVSWTVVPRAALLASLSTVAPFASLTVVEIPGVALVIVNGSQAPVFEL